MHDAMLGYLAMGVYDAMLGHITKGARRTMLGNLHVACATP